MAITYTVFAFGSDEEKAQNVRHHLDVMKQAFRLDKKLLYKFERSGDAAEAVAPGVQEEEEIQPAAKRGAKPGKAKEEKPAKAGKTEQAKPGGDVTLYLRLAFSAHEKMTEERILKRIASEQPFAGYQPKPLRAGSAGFDDAEAKFEALD